MLVIKNYKEQYDALPCKQRKAVLAAFRKWGCWSKATVYNKLAGQSVTPIEQVLIDGVMSFYSKTVSQQLELTFVWDDETKGLKSDQQEFVNYGEKQ